MRSSYAWALGGQLASQASFTIISIWVARLLQPQDYGLWAIACVFVAFCRSAQDAGIESALIQRQDLDERTLCSAFWFLLAGGVVATTLVWACAPAVAWVYHDPRVVPLMRVMAFMFLPIALRIIPFSMLAKHLEFGSRTKAEFLAALGASLTTLWAARSGFGVWSLIAGAFAGEVLLCIFLYWFYPWRPRFEFHAATLKPLIRFGLPVTGSGLLWQFYVQADIVIVGYLLGPASVGFYSMASKLATLIPEKVAAVMNKVNYPVFSSLQRKPGAVGEHWVKVSEATAWLCAPGLCGLMLLSNSFVSVALTPKWLPIVPTLKILCIVALVRSLGIIVPHLVTALNHPDRVFIFNVISALVLPLSFALGAWLAGLIGVATGWLVGYSLTIVWLFRLALQKTGVSGSNYFRSLRDPALATLALAVAVMLAGYIRISQPLPRLIAQVLAGAVAYCGCAIFLLWKSGELRLYTNLLRPLSAHTSKTVESGQAHPSILMEREDLALYE